MASALEKCSPANAVMTDKYTYEQYVKAGLWVPLETVKFHRYCAGIVKCKVQMKAGRRQYYWEERPVVIKQYFPPSMAE